ncbi:GH39 family glycosyl hydrolase [Synoicihabitans lomoniglobus]|uniref:Beta-xylosidase n=1 Tax=Synoicihabitans lomoniglobus TaxID=2909285 RepID=A0AAE9ZS52_9BACT|nr:beta-xylosidase [Opitutaceae bacterium LMO-M01]WED64230.1 beta-xylosidase [Opitutaceae bacterium LMO-M01]
MRLPHRILLLGLATLTPTFGADESFPVAVTVDAGDISGPLRDFWRYYGGDEPNYATMKDGQKLLGQLGELAPGRSFIRLHNLLNTGDGTPAFKWGSTNAYTEDADGNPVYDWTGIDRIFDSGLERGVRPLVEIGFMPQALSSQPEPYRHEWRPGFDYSLIYTGWRMPPTDYAKWEELVYQWTKHCVERYGRAEVETWWWQVWNEANNQPNGYWGGTIEEFLKLNDYAIAGVRRALPTARVGGPHTAGSGGAFMEAFLDHALHGTNYATGETGTPLDFVAFHAKGSPRFVDDHVRMGIANQLRTIDRAFTTFGDYPELAGIPVIIGESDPEGCAACQGPQLAYRNGTMYSSYTAASFARKHDLADIHATNLEGAVTWAFTFENQPYFAGFRQLASNGLALPVLNVFRMFAHMGPERIAAKSDHQVPLDAILADGVRADPDVGVLASRNGHQIAVLVWHYHDDDMTGPEADVTINLTDLPLATRAWPVTHYRIDQDHSNAYAAWLRMGSPLAPTKEQYDALEAASALTPLGPATAVTVTDGAATLNFPLPRQGVSLIVIGENL